MDPKLLTSPGRVLMKEVVGRNFTTFTLEMGCLTVNELMLANKKSSLVDQSTFQNYIKKKNKALGIEVVPKEGKNVGMGKLVFE